MEELKLKLDFGKNWASELESIQKAMRQEVAQLSILGRGWTSEEAARVEKLNKSLGLLQNVSELWSERP